MNKEPVFFIQHIWDSIERIERFSAGITKEKLASDEMRQSAIIRQVEIIGEAVKNLPPHFISKYPFVSWSEIARARDKLIHHYFGVDLDIIWNIINISLPKLKKEIKEILEKEEKHEKKN